MNPRVILFTLLAVVLALFGCQAVRLPADVDRISRRNHRARGGPDPRRNGSHRGLPRP
jgi:hypothetical protein